MDILVVEDNQVTSKLLEKTLEKHGYKVVIADNGQAAWELFNTQNFDIIITDWMVPEMDGITLCKKIRAVKSKKYIYIIILTSKDEVTDSVEGFKAGADDYIIKPFKPEELIARVQPGIRIIELEKKVTEKTKSLLKKHNELEESYMDTIRLLSSLIEMLHPVLGEYMIKVGELSKMLAEDFGLEKNMVVQIEIAGLFHDIALLGLPENILSKDVVHMSPTEFGLYSQHPVIASLSFQSVKRLSKVGEIILNHHENHDGSGFPKGLKGSEIPIESSIISVVSDYCWIIQTWPMDTEEIKKKFVENFGNEAADSLISNDPDTLPDTLIEEAGQKAIELGSGVKYDASVVEKLIKRIAYEKIAEKKRKWVDVDELKDGMILEKNLILKDGRHLLSKGTIFNDASIKSLQQIKILKGIEEKIYVMTK